MPRKYRMVWALVAMIAVTTLVAPIVVQARAQPGTYDWSFTCKSRFGIPGAASWAWLKDGAVILGTGGRADCDVNGSGNRPAEANGFTATLSSCELPFDLSRSGCTYHEVNTVTLSFDATKPFSTDVRETFVVPFWPCLCGAKMTEDLSIQSWPA